MPIANKIHRHLFLHRITIFWNITITIVFIVNRDDDDLIVFVRLSVFSVSSPTLVDNTAEQREHCQNGGHYAHVPWPTEYYETGLPIGQFVHC